MKKRWYVLILVLVVYGLLYWLSGLSNICGGLSYYKTVNNLDDCNYSVEWMWPKMPELLNSRCHRGPERWLVKRVVLNESREYESFPENRTYVFESKCIENLFNQVEHFPEAVYVDWRGNFVVYIEGNI